MDLKMVKPNSLTLGSGKISLFPKKVEYPFNDTGIWCWRKWKKKSSDHQVYSYLNGKILL